MLFSSLRSFVIPSLVPVWILTLASCGVNAGHRAGDVGRDQRNQDSTSSAKALAPKYLIARIAQKDVNAQKAKVDFVAVSSDMNVQSPEAVDKAFKAGQVLNSGAGGSMALAGNDAVRIDLGLTALSGPCDPGLPCGVPPSAACCSNNGGILSFFGNIISGIFSGIGSVLKALNPFAWIGNTPVAYGNGSQVNYGTNQYTVYPQVPGAPNGYPNGYSNGYPSQDYGPVPVQYQQYSQPQGQQYPQYPQYPQNSSFPNQATPTGQEPMPTQLGAN